MTKKAISDGRQMDVVLAAAVVAGTGRLLGGAGFGIALNSGAINDTVPFALAGEHEHAAEVADAWAQGDQLYWNDTNKTLTDTVGTNRKIGIAGRAKVATTESTGSIILSLAQ